MLLVVLIAVAGAAGADSNIAFIEGPGIHVPGGDTQPCPGELHLNHDGSTEGAFTWQNEGIAAPDYGAFAEGYAGITWDVCGAQLLLMRWGTMTGSGEIDVYVWDYDVATDNPGAVLSLTASVDISGVVLWPNVSTHDIDCADAPATGNGCFIGYWPRSFVGTLAQFGCAMDEDGPGGVPRTNIAPGIGYPTGWNHPNAVGYTLQAFGIGGWFSPCPPGSSGACCLPDGTCVQMQAVDCVDYSHGQWYPCTPCSQIVCEPTPVETGSWGRVKRSYR